MSPYNYKRVAILTGAGISAESGLKTFRDNHGLWEGHRVEDVATPQAYVANPDLVHKFYNLRRAQLNDVQPNLAHEALAQFESKFSGEYLLITQNVDDLHERAGSRNVLHMHGQLRQARCTVTGKIYDWQEDLSVNLQNPDPSLPKGTLRPHICWFGEMPFYMDEIYDYVSHADLFVAIGTSGVVYPAAGLVGMTNTNCHKLIINLAESENSGAFDEFRSGPASEEVPRFFEFKGEH